MSKEQRQKVEETRGLVEKKDCHYNEEEEIRRFENYERWLRAAAAESFKSKNLLNYWRNFRREYCPDISSDDDYRSSSVREFDDIRPVRSVKGKRTRSLRTKQGFRSRHRKARPKRKRIDEILECPSRNCEICDPCCPYYERTRIDDDRVESFTRYFSPNKRRSRPTYPVSKLTKRHSDRLVSPQLYGRYLKRGSKEWEDVNNVEPIGGYTDQRLSRRTNDKEHRSESRRRSPRRNDFEERQKKRSTDSIYMNPRYKRSYIGCNETITTRKDPEVHPCVVDKTNESSFQKRLSGGSNFSGSTNNQYCPRLDGPSSSEEEEEEDDVREKEKGKGSNKSRRPKWEESATRKEEKKICGKFDGSFKDPSCVESRSRYPLAGSFSSLSSARSTKGVTFEKKVSEIPCKTPRQVPTSARKSEKTSSFVEKRVHYDVKCLKTGDPRKNKEDLCCLCENEKFDNKSDRRYRKLCKLVRSREGKTLLNCCCSGNEQEDNAECDQCCRCPENLKIFQAPPQYDTSRSYERSWKGKDILHFTSLPGTSFGPNSSSRLAEDTCAKNHRRKESDLQDPSPDLSLSDHWKKCRDRLNDFNEEYRKLSNDVKSIRQIYCPRDKARRKTDRLYPSTEKDILTGARSLQRRTMDSRSPNLPNEIQEIDCDCKEFLRRISPSTCRHDRYGRSYDRRDARRDTELRKKLENDSVRTLENFCDRVKAMNRRPSESKTKTNLENKTLQEDRPWCDCLCESETSVQELWKPSKRSIRQKWPVGNSADLRIVKPKKSSGKTNLEKILIYPPEGAAGPPLTLFKNSSNISCQVKGDVDRGYRYDVTYIQKFVSPSWRPVEECPGNGTIRRNRNECDCSSDYGRDQP